MRDIILISEFKGAPASKELNIQRVFSGALVLLFSLVAQGSFFMSENRIAVLSVIVEDRAASPRINSILSDFGDYVVGRMGIPNRQKGVSVICVVLDAPVEIINGVTGKIGMLAGVSAKTVTSKK